MSTPLRAEIEIDAAPDQVWHVLADFAAYPDWNPFIRRLDGLAAVGSRLTTRIEPPGGMGMTLRPTVLAAVAGHELRWLGHLGVPGLFDGEHSFRIESIGTQRVRFVQEEHFTGLLAPLVLKFIQGQTQQGFKEMNQALKSRAEDLPTPRP
jgi:hypothetical protein